MTKQLTAKIDLNKIKILNIFKWISKNGVDDYEMLRTFNCGVGFVLFAKKQNVTKISKIFSSKFKPYIIGEVVNKGSSKIEFIGNANF